MVFDLIFLTFKRQKSFDQSRYFLDFCLFLLRKKMSKRSSCHDLHLFPDLIGHAARVGQQRHVAGGDLGQDDGAAEGHGRRQLTRYQYYKTTKVKLSKINFLEEA